MENALAKIRPQTSSNLAHQKTPATLLQALEATFQEQGTERSPTAYFAALLTTLDTTLQRNDIGLGDGDVLPAELYLLALVAPFVPQTIIRAQLTTLLSLSAPLFPSLLPHAPPLRSQLSLYHSIFLALDRSQLEVQGIRQVLASVLQLCLDARPKVRRKAADLVRDILASPPPPMARHPYADRVAEWIKSSLAEVNTGVFARSGKNAAVTDTAIHILAFLRPVVPYLPLSTLPSITNLLLSLPCLGNPYLSHSAYSILNDCFATSDKNEDSQNTAQTLDVLNAIISSPPSKNDKNISPAWLQLIGTAMLAFHTIDSEACAVELTKAWRIVWVFLESTDAQTRNAAAQSLSLLTRCITPALILAAINEENLDEPKSELGKIIMQSSRALESLAYAPSIPEVLTVISSLITSLSYRESPAHSTAAESLLLPTVKMIGNLRTSKGFEYKEAADTALATAMRVLGPEILLRVLPLNLEPEYRQTGEEPRAYLLPLLAHPHPSPLKHFVSYFVPLSERMFDLQQKAEVEGRASEAKVWSVLVAQIWTGFSGYCCGSVDLRETMTPAFCQILSQLLYSQPELRPAVLKSLKLIVDSNVALASSDRIESNIFLNGNNIGPEEAAQNIAFLRSQAESWLSVLFNVFGSVGRDGRGMVGEVISVWAAIASNEELTKAYHKVVELFKQNLAKPRNVVSNDPSENGSITAIMQDLLILLLPHLLPADAGFLFELCLTTEVLGNNDSGVQKRGYKILTRLIELNKVTVDAEHVHQTLDEPSDSLAPAAKKDRFNLLTSLVPLIPASALHIILSLIPEAVLGTKEPSEKARSAAFDLEVTMGRKMRQGGVVKRAMVAGMTGGDDVEVNASVEEYMTMIAGGLAGASPHMISATVTSISRLIFEFKDDISPQMHTEIFKTLLVFLSSANREIVKSTLGFIKLAIHTLPTELLRPYLGDLVPALLKWSHDHKNHFKAKVRHIFERMIRRFGWDDVHSCAGEEEAAKVLVNIKKRKERAKRKKMRGEDEVDDVSAPKVSAGNAFEDVLYGSESELDDSDDEPDDSNPQQKRGERGARLRIDNDGPMDLLQGATSHITNLQVHRRRRPGQDAFKFKVNEDTGKMIIDEDSSNDEAAKPATDISGTAYREGITSADGFTRGPNGRIKFNKDTKKRRREGEGDVGEDVEMDAADASAPRVKAGKRRPEVKLGHQFKAKRAGGDIKRAGVDPYAYVTLSQAAKTGRGGHGRIGIAGKH